MTPATARDRLATSSPALNPESADLRRSIVQRLEPQLHLPAWLLARRFAIAALQPDPARLVMRGPAQEELHLHKDLDRGVWTYTNRSDPTDHGTVTDFMIRHDHALPDACASRLASCVLPGNASPEAVAYQEVLRDPTTSLYAAERLHLAAVREERDAKRQLQHFGADPHTLDEWRFGPVRGQRDVANLIRDPSALTHSRYRPTDRELVIVERPIDAIAYEAARGKQRACYVYVGDDPSSETKQKLAHVLADVPSGIRVISALGRGRRAEELSADITRMCRDNVARAAPDLGARWSDQMQIQHRHRRSLERGGVALGR